MALLIDNKAVFLHTPKTAGTWFRHAMQICDIPYTELGSQHDHFPHLRELAPDGFYDDKFIFAFVRHPLTWYQSRWAFRVQHGWHMDHPVDYSCASNDFHDFLRRMLIFRPTGWMTYLFGLYVDFTPHPIDFIGRTENAIDDAVGALRQIGVNFDEQKFRNVPRMNASVLDGRSSGYWARYSPELLDAILSAEHDYIRRFYASYPIERSNFLC